jgi:zinc transporter ZupT
MVTLMIGFVTPLGTLLAMLVGALSPGSSALILALAAGAMIYVVGHDTLPESLRASPPGACLGMLVGALVMLGVHAYLGM